jgi:hypothetical protein
VRVADDRGARTGRRAECAVQRAWAKRQQPGEAVLPVRSEHRAGVAVAQGAAASLARAAEPALWPGGRVHFFDVN